MNDILQLATHGLAMQDAALAIARVGTGVFFACSGYNKLFNPGRHRSFRTTLIKDHVPAIKFNEWWVPSWEFLGGILLAIGLFTAFSASVLLIICLVACAAEAKQRIIDYAPINKADVIADLLYLQEVLYILLLSVNILAGTGKFSVDALLF